MSKVSTIYDNFVSLISTTLTDFTQLPNAYEAVENPSLFLRKGFGLAIGPASNTGRLLGQTVTIAREFNLLLIQEVLTTTTNTSSRTAMEKTLMENLFKIIDAVEVDKTLNGVAIKVKYINDNGIEFAESDRNKYLLTEAIFEVEYLERYPC